MVIHSQLLTYSASEVAAMIEGAIHHGTAMDVEANYVDTHGQSIVGFGLTRRCSASTCSLGSRASTGSGSTRAGADDAYPGLEPALMARPIRWA